MKRSAAASRVSKERSGAVAPARLGDLVRRPVDLRAKPACARHAIPYQPLASRQADLPHGVADDVDALALLEHAATSAACWPMP